MDAKSDIYKLNNLKNASIKVPGENLYFKLKEYFIYYVQNRMVSVCQIISREAFNF